MKFAVCWRCESSLSGSIPWRRLAEFATSSLRLKYHRSGPLLAVEPATGAAMARTRQSRRTRLINHYIGHCTRTRSHTKVPFRFADLLEVCRNRNGEMNNAEGWGATGLWAALRTEFDSEDVTVCPSRPHKMRRKFPQYHSHHATTASTRGGTTTQQHKQRTRRRHQYQTHLPFTIVAMAQ